MAYDIAGKVKLIQEPQVFASGFTKRCLIVEVEDGKYSQQINVEFLQDKIGLLDDLNEGDLVTVNFNLRGREHGGNYYNSIVGWKLSVDAKADGEQDRPAMDGVGTGSPEAPAGGDLDDIPF